MTALDNALAALEDAANGHGSVRTHRLQEAQIHATLAVLEALQASASARPRAHRGEPVEPLTLDGAGDYGDIESLPADAEQFATRWNAMPVEDRDEFVRILNSNAEKARHCHLSHPYVDIMPAGSRPFIDLNTTGLLWLINRQVFHPLGFALALHTDNLGRAVSWSLQGDGVAPMNFPDGMETDSRRLADQTLAEAREQARRAAEPEPQPEPEVEVEVEVGPEVEVTYDYDDGVYGEYGEYDDDYGPR